MTKLSVLLPSKCFFTLRPLRLRVKPSLGLQNRRKTGRVYQKKADGDFEAHLVALSFSEPPEGFSR